MSPASPAADLAIGLRFEHDDYPAISTSWTHEARFQSRKRKVRSARIDQRFKIELLAINAPPYGLGAFAIAVSAPHVHLPAKGFAPLRASQLP
jgi:hypothetical protein